MSPVFEIAKKSGGTRIVAMVKDDNKSKRSGVTPFLYKPELWPEDAATQNIKTTENGHILFFHLYDSLTHIIRMVKTMPSN